METWLLSTYNAFSPWKTVLRELQERPGKENYEKYKELLTVNTIWMLDMQMALCWCQSWKENWKKKKKHGVMPINSITTIPEYALYWTRRNQAVIEILVSLVVGGVLYDRDIKRRRRRTELSIKSRKSSLETNENILFCYKMKGEETTEKVKKKSSISKRKRWITWQIREMRRRIEKGKKGV